MARPSTKDTESVARGYFGALEAGDRGAVRDWYAEDGVVQLKGSPREYSREEWADYFDGLYAAIPDFRFHVVDVLAQSGRAAVHWRITGTFAGPGDIRGLAPNGSSLDFEGVDLVTVRDGKIARNDAFANDIVIARQLGLLPPEDSPLQDRMNRAANVRAAAARKMHGWTGPEEVADGVWRVQGNPGRCTVYFLRDGDGVTMYDAGGVNMLPHVRATVAQLGGLKRIVLGHGHTDHRGTAPGLGAPVFCHPDEVVDAEGSGGFRYWDDELRFLSFPHRQLQKWFHHHVWDGGPVRIAGTVSEGDELAGFRVVHLPGHAPGLIGLFREADRVALASDVAYTIDMWGRDQAAGVPIAGYNLDTEQARTSIRKLAELEPSVVWLGHAEPVRGDVRAELLRAADAT